MKHQTIFLLFFCSILFCVQVNAQDSPVEYMNMIEKAEEEANQKYLAYVSTAAHSGRVKKIERMRQQVLDGIVNSRNKVIALPLYKGDKALWQSSIDVACIAAACLAYYNGRVPRSGLNKDVLTLMALVHNIGALPLITEAERQQDLLGDSRFLLFVATRLATDVSVRILFAWSFDEPFHQVALNWQKLQPEKPGPGYTDFIRLAVIARDGYSDKDVQQRLLDYYVNLQLVPQPDFMQHPEIQAVYQDVRAMFS